MTAQDVNKFSTYTTAPFRESDFQDGCRSDKKETG